MVRLAAYLIAVLAVAAGLSWLADRPGTVHIEWLGYTADPSVFSTIVGFILALGVGYVLIYLLHQMWRSPATIGHFFNHRRHKRGLEALTSGMIAIGSGDRHRAAANALQARRALPNEPLTHLLRAQAAQLSGDRATARRIYEAMLGTPETEQLGLRGLYLEAEHAGAAEPARHYAERALALNPKLGWPIEALLDQQCKAADFEAALETVAVARRNGHMDRASADRKRAVMLTALAQQGEERDPIGAMNQALEAHGLAPDLVPAAAIAGRLLAGRGNTQKATKVIRKTWGITRHPDLAEVCAHARIGDSPHDRLLRVQELARLAPQSVESGLAVASAALAAKDYSTARGALEPFVGDRLTRRVAVLMARIEGEEHGDKGKVREWLARAVKAPADPAWVADGIVSPVWRPLSPVTGRLDAFVWQIPGGDAKPSEGKDIAEEIEEYVALGAPASKSHEAAAPGGGETAHGRAPEASPAFNGRPVTEEAGRAPSATSSPSADRSGATPPPSPRSAAEEAPRTIPSSPPDDPGIDAVDSYISGPAEPAAGGTVRPEATGRQPTGGSPSR